MSRKTEWQRRHRFENRERLLPIVREARKSESAKRTARAWYAKNKERILAARKARRVLVRARTKINNAVRDGRAARLPCQICNQVRSEAHHCDYSQPLDVMWLCAVHHRAWHRVFESTR